MAVEIDIDPGDRQAIRVYRAQTAVIVRHPEDELADLAAVRAYVADLAATARVAPPACHLLLRHSGGPPPMVDLSNQERDRTGEQVVHPDGRNVTILRWLHRMSHYDKDNYMIGLGTTWDRPMCHRLLVVHEMAHVVRPTTEAHGPEWVAEFRALAASQLPHLHRELRIALNREGVISSRPTR